MLVTILAQVVRVHCRICRGRLSAIMTTPSYITLQGLTAEGNSIRTVLKGYVDGPDCWWSIGGVLDCLLPSSQRQKVGKYIRTQLRSWSEGLGGFPGPHLRESGRMSKSRAREVTETVTECVM